MNAIYLPVTTPPRRTSKKTTVPKRNQVKKTRGIKKSKNLTSIPKSTKTQRCTPELSPSHTQLLSIFEEPRFVEESSTDLPDLYISTPLIHIPFDTLGLLTRYRPTRHFVGKSTARNIKKIFHKIIKDLQSLEQRDLLQSDNATQLLKKLFLTHFIILGFHVDKVKTPFSISEELLAKENWEEFCVGSYQLRKTHEKAASAMGRKEQQRKRCDKLIKQGFISKAVNCLQDKISPYPKRHQYRGETEIPPPPRSPHNGRSPRRRQPPRDSARPRQDRRHSKYYCRRQRCEPHHPHEEETQGSLRNLWTPQRTRIRTHPWTRGRPSP